MFEIKHLKKVYNAGTVNEHQLFDDFSLSIQPHSFVSIIGSNGSGKSSLLNLICGSLTADSGRILHDGRDISKLPEYKRAKFIGRVFQDPAKGSCGSMSILENMSMAENKGRPFGLSLCVKRKREERYCEMLESLHLGLENKLHVQVGLLSGGQRQALALLTATMTPIDLLILDEHTAALDPKTSEIIMTLTSDIVREKQLTTIMVTHNLRSAIDYGSRLLMMHEGVCVMDKSDQQKYDLKLDDVLQKFYEISIEAGN